MDAVQGSKPAKAAISIMIFYYVQFRAAGVEGAVNVRAEVRGSCAFAVSAATAAILARFQIQTVARVHIAEDKFDGVAREIG